MLARASLLLGLLAVEALALTPGAVPPPPRGRWSNDLTGRIRRETLAEVDRIAASVDAQQLGQLGVAVVETTSGTPHRAFATEVFNRWGIGRTGRDDGILLFVALGDRKAEIILGDGLGDISTDLTDRIMQSEVVGNFRRGDPDGALTEGARALSALLSARAGSGQAPVEAAQAAPAEIPPDVQRVLAIAAGQEPFPNPRPRGWTVDLEGRLDKQTLSALNRVADEVYAAGRGRLFVVSYRSSPRYVPTGELAMLARKEFASASDDKLYLVVASTDPAEVLLVAPPLIEGDSDGQRELQRIEAQLRQGLSSSAEEALVEAATQMGKMALEGPPTRSVLEVSAEVTTRHLKELGAALVALAFGGLWWLRHFLRNRPRPCNRCGRPRELLNEQADDVHLTSSQKKEEQLASVDHDVWYCVHCRDALVIPYKAWLSSYSKCGSCQAVTVKSSSVTLIHANYDRGGTVEVTETCAHCGYSRKFNRYTARLTRSSSSSSSSRSSFSSGRSSSSFGGGRSSGRGSSGGW